MIDYTKLNSKIKGSGLKQNMIASQIGITPKTLSAKLNGKSDFTISQAEHLSKILHLTSNEMSHIFFSE